MIQDLTPVSYDVSMFLEEGLDLKDAEETADWFTQFPGPINVQVETSPVPTSPNYEGVLVWRDLFAILGQLRANGQFPPTTFVTLLTKTPNEQNWFAVPDPQEMRNGFVHYEDFSWITSAPSSAIAAHYTLKGIFNALLGDAQIPWQEVVHEDARGCLFDFCRDKRELGIKLKTADICGDCMKVFQSTGMPDSLIQQTTAIMEATRKLATNTG